MIKWLLQWWAARLEKDPYYSCAVHNELGCSHVDGFLCDYPDCSILRNYREAHKGEVI